jgi:hypothetical protein
VRRGAYVDGGLWQHAGPDSRYRLTVTAVLRSRGVAEAASHHSAVALHRLPLWDVDRRVVVVSSDVQESTTTAGLRVTPLRALAALDEVEGLECLAVADAVVTTASRSVEAGVVAADAALHQGMVSLEELRDARDRLAAGLRGRALLRRALASLDPAAESPGESRTRLVLSALDLPVTSQAVVRDRGGRFVARVDFLVAGRVVVEFDGAVKYSGAEGREALVAEKRREDELRALGYEVVRLVWADLSRPDRVIVMVRSALSRCAA